MFGDDSEPFADGTEPTPEQLDALLEMSTHVRNSQAIGLANALQRAASAIAGMYLREAAFDRAKLLLTRLIISNDEMIVLVETLLRVARRVGRPPGDLCGEPIPSLRRADGTTIPMTARLVEAAGWDKLILSEETDDPGSRSNANLAIRPAREEVRRLARDVMLEGGIVA